MMADKPRKWQLIELGPGRGTLMADMLRVTDNIICNTCVCVFVCVCVCVRVCV